MNIPFYKYQGTGNDFVMVDNRKEVFQRHDDFEFISELCDRKFGIGADGFILLEKAVGYDFMMVYFNANGHEGSMCGNGGRCTVAFARDLGIITDSTTFLAIDGPHEATINKEIVSLKMIDVDSVESNADFSFLNTGSPHYVTFVDNLAELDVFEEGSKIRYNDRFRAEGTNVNFVQQVSPEQIRVRTYERGVEDETLSCGTGVTACAIVNFLNNGVDKTTIHAEGGELKVSLQSEDKSSFQNIWLEGPASLVFKGEILQD